MREWQACTVALCIFATTGFQVIIAFNKAVQHIPLVISTDGNSSTIDCSRIVDKVYLISCFRNKDKVIGCSIIIEVAIIDVREWLTLLAVVEQ